MLTTRMAVCVPLPRYRPLPPRIKVSYPKGMTIAAGFVARNGVLLCTDSLYSGGIRTHGRKIFTHPLDHGVVSFALAGHEPFAKKAIEDCKSFLDQNRDSHTSIASIKAAIEVIVKATWEN